MYKLLARPLLFLFDPEKIHHFAFRMLGLWFRIPGAARLDRWIHRLTHPDLEREVFGLKFPNPVGLAAGFDKDAKLTDHWSAMGFGFVEIGTVTPRPQVGNPKKRLFRLPKDKALINRMGFNNGGVEAMVARLKKRNSFNLIVGGNIGKNKDTPNEKAAEDYKICFEALFPYVDYFVVNVSSPNTPGLRELQEKEPLTRLLNSLQNLNQKKDKPKPILLKIAPDMGWGQVDDILDIVRDTGLAGLVATNTTVSREGLQTPAAEVEAIGNGGLSGAPLTDRAQEFIRYIREKAGPDLPIIAVGGIMSPEDAVARLKAGATLVQVYTGFVYEGPFLQKKICKAILKN
ncbi:MAG: quinone-dependent dihydroorotate dehydrogenase [Bacteroidota bacterium]